MTSHLRDEELIDPPASGKIHLESCGTCAARRDAQLAVRGALRALPREAEVPSAALAVLDAQRSRRRSSKRALLAVAAALVLGGTAAAVLLHRPRRPLSSDLADELALDHIHYERHVDAAEVRGDPATISSYFSRTLGFAPHYGPLEAATFEGAKPCRIAGKWTALAWIDRAGHWLSLFTMPEHEVLARGCATTEGVRVCGAPDPRGGARVIVGDLPEAEMLRLVDDSLR